MTVCALDESTSVPNTSVSLMTVKLRFNNAIKELLPTKIKIQSKRNSSCGTISAQKIAGVIAISKTDVS